MTTFPNLVPTGWPLQPGTYPASIQQTLSGRTSIVRYTDSEQDIRLPLSFILTEAQFLQLVAHYEEHGTVLPFPFTSATVPDAHTPAGYRWRYEQEPVSVEDVYKDYFRVSCVFVGNLYPDVFIGADTAYMFMRGVEATVSIPRTVAPPAPTLTITGLANGITRDGFAEVTGIQPRATWQFSLDGGATWQAGNGNGFAIPQASYAAGAIRARQTDSDGNISAAAAASALQVVPANTAVLALFSLAGGATATGTVTLPAAGRVVRFTTSRAGWFSLYASAAAATADASRPPETEPGYGKGVCIDPRLFVAGAIDYMPFGDFRNEESPQTRVYPWKFKNESETGDVVITFTYIVDVT